MGDMPKRDTKGECEGECRDRVKEGEKERQTKLEEEGVESPESYNSPPDAKKRKEQPGTKGGHV